MADATQQLGVDYSATGLRNILRSIDDLEAATSRAEKSFNSMYKAAAGGKGLLALTGPTANNLNVTTNGGTSRVTNQGGKINIAVMVRVVGGGGGGNLTPAGTGGSSRRIGAYGPRQRRASLMAALTSGSLSGDAYHDTKDALARLDNKGGSPFSKISTAIRSTRFNVGGVSPLVGRSIDAALSPLDMLGPEGAVAKEAIEAVVTASTACALALYGLAKASSDAGVAFGRTSYDLGSGPGTTGRLTALGSSLGISPSSLANSIQSNITGGGMGTAAGLRLGVYNLPGMFGNQDYGSQALTVIQHLRKVSDPTERLRLARAVGGSDATSLMQAASLTGKDAALIDSSGNTAAHVMDQKMQQDAIAFQSASSQMADAFSRLAAAAGQGEMERITSAFRGWTNLLNDAADWVKNNQSTIDMMTAITEGIVGQINPMIGSALAMGRAADTGKDLRDNTAATEENTRATLQPGTYGRISRQGSTTPEMFNGQQFQQGRDMANRRLSTY